MSHSSDLSSVASGLAALSICESLLLAMGDLRLMGAKDTIDVISDAASAHRNAGDTPQDIALHREVAAVLDLIIAGANPVRRSSPRL